MKYNIHILMGLPGSGKSYFAKTFNIYNSHVISFDDSNDTNYIGRINQLINSYDAKKEYVLDGLVLTTDDIAEIMSGIKRAIKDKKAKVIIHYWNENREECKKNDLYRTNITNERKVNSQITIENADFDSLSDVRNYVANTFKDSQFEIDIVLHDVYKMDDFDEIINKYSSQSNEGKQIITSESWCNGGTWCNCWGKEGTVEPDPKPEFVEFDELLTELSPNITFLQYKKLFNSCVSVYDYEEQDYYGGSTSNSYYVCDVKKLKNLIKEMGLF